MAVYRHTVGGSPHILFYKPPQATPNIRPELEENAYQYFWQSNARTYPATGESLYRIYLNPDQPLQEGLSLRMVPTDRRGSCQPGHLPSVYDAASLSTEFECLINNHIEVATVDENKPLFPGYLLHLIDPYPTIDLTPPPYRLEHGDIRVSMACFLDAVQVIYLPTAFRVVVNVMVFTQFGNDSPKYHCAVTQTFNNAPLPTLPCVPPNSSIVCFNARDVARPSFKPNFQAIYDRHMPEIVVLFEVRNTVSNLSEVIHTLHGNYMFVPSILRSHASGAAILWRADAVRGVSRNQQAGSQCLLDVNITKEVRDVQGHHV